MMHHCLLDEAIISTIERPSQLRSKHTLPGVFAALVRDEIDDFPALRPHQRHVWHAFLVQIAVIFLHRSGASTLPATESEWRTALLSLTPDDPDGAAWALVSPLNRPALLQPPIAEASLAGFKAIATPDALDMLVTAKNHDLKRNAIRAAKPEHWLFALLSLQTQEGFLGAGNYGISRMNGGFSSRPAIGIVPSGGLGRSFERDSLRLLALRNRILEENSAYPSVCGHALLWLLAWTGDVSLSPTSLDPFYIDICRRVRIQLDSDGEISAATKGTKAARIDGKALKGRTGDGWTPLVADGSERKALTIDSSSFSFKRLTPMLFPRASDVSAPSRAPLQAIGPNDDPDGLKILAHGTVRGQGKTEGYHNRRIEVSASLRRFLVEIPSDECAAVAEDRVRDAGTMAKKVLFPATLTVFTAAPMDGERKRDDDTAKDRAGRVLKEFDARVDQTFFSELSRELDVLIDSNAAANVRAVWLQRLMAQARDLLEQCARAAPASAMRSYRTRACARDRLEAAFSRFFGDRAQLTEPTENVDHTAERVPNR